ncbi:MAG TPA: DUF3078 domain-containing protein [Paludibacter sp.]
MKFKSLITFTFLIYMVQANAMQPVEQSDSLRITLQGVIDPDSLLENISIDSKLKPKTLITLPKTPLLLAHPKTEINSVNVYNEKQAFDSLMNVKSIESKNSTNSFTIPTNIKPMHIDTLVLRANPFFIELVYENIPLNFDWNLHSDFCKLCYGKKATSLTENAYKPIKIQTSDQFIADLRRDARNEITRKAINLYAFRFDQLPNPNNNKNFKIKGKPLEKIQFVDDEEVFNAENRKMYIKKIQVSPWQHKSSVLAQFSENAVSSNWYQGGSSNVAVLGILSGQLNYDNNRSVQWENNAEWRMGFNTVSGDTLHMISTNDDVVKINSKLGIKAGGNWFYSGSVDLSTQLLNSYKGINSTELKTSFLTPVRVNIGVGFDYKYKKLFSLMISPVSYKYIYMNDCVNIDPNLFGIKKGENVLSELGSSFKAVFSYAPIREIQLDSKFSFYTNYQKVEIDWEMVCNFTINRFMSTRISFNPRYDNTVIEKNGEHAMLQYKQLLSVGFSHRFR